MRFIKIFYSQISFSELLFVNPSGRTIRNDSLLKFYICLFQFSRGGHINRGVKRSVCRSCRIRKSQFWFNVSRLRKIGLIYENKLPIQQWYRMRKGRRYITRHLELRLFKGSYFALPISKGMYVKDFDLRSVLKTAMENSLNPTKQNKPLIPELSAVTKSRRKAKHRAYVNRLSYTGRNPSKFFTSKLHDLKKCEKSIEENLISIIVQQSRDQKGELRQIPWYKTRKIRKDILAYQGRLYFREIDNTYKRIYPKPKLNKETKQIEWSLPDSHNAKLCKPTVSRETLIRENQLRFASRMSPEQIKASPIYKRFAKKK